MSFQSTDAQTPSNTAKPNVPVQLSFQINANVDQLPIKQVQINWGDGDVQNLDALRDIDNQTVSVVHTYSSEGTFTVKVDALDNWCWSTSQFLGLSNGDMCDLGTGQYFLSMPINSTDYTNQKNIIVSSGGSSNNATPNQN